MALKQVAYSDISNKEISDDKHSRVVVNGYPGIPGSVELDVSSDEADKLQSVKLELVNLTIHEPNKRSRQVVLDAETLASTFKNVDIEAVLRSARRGNSEPSVTRRPRGSASPKSGIDYSDMAHAGKLHRGRITEAEAEVVRNNLEAINKRMKAEGGRHIDPKDAAEKKRYGF